MTPTPGLVLFAHGSRDARWADPFRSIASAIARQRPDVRVILAFLETMRPTLDEAVDDLVVQGCVAIRIAPIFLGQGGHVRDDFPRLVSSLQAKLPNVTFDCLTPAGEDASVQDAVAAFCVQGL